MEPFIVRVTCYHLNSLGQPDGQIAAAYVPVEAPDEEEACKRAVLWHGDNGVAVEDHDLQWICADAARGLLFKATKCLRVTPSEMDVFLLLTQGLHGSQVIGRTTRPSLT